MSDVLKKQKGFTLLEVLVVVAIIAVLVSVVVFSVNNSKLKGADAAIQASLTQAKDQAEVFYNVNSRNYDGVCQNNANDLNTIGRFLVAGQGTWGIPANPPYNDGGDSSFANNIETCNDNALGYAAWIKLPWASRSSDTAWCIDSTNFSGTVTTVLPGGDITCL